MEEVSHKRAMFIAIALQKMIKDKTVTLIRQPLKGDRVLFTYKVDDGGKSFHTVTYSEGYFDDEMYKGDWLFTQIYRQLIEGYRWKMMLPACKISDESCLPRQSKISPRSSIPASQVQKLMALGQSI